VANVDLRFVQSPGSSNLLFGGDQTGPSPPIDATLVATLPALTFAARAIPNADFALVASFPRLEMVAEGKYQSYAVRPTVGRNATDWQRANEFKSGVEERREVTARSRALGSALWADGRAHQAGVEDRRAGRLLRAPLAASSSHQDAARAAIGGAADGYGDAIRLRTARDSVYEEALRAEWARSAAGHQDGWRDRRREIASRYTEGRRHAGLRQYEAIQSADVLRRWLLARWQVAMVPPPGVHPPDPVTPPAPERCYTPSPALLFAALAVIDGHLLFVCERQTEPVPDEEPVLVPIRRVYFVLNNVTLHRVADGVEAPVFNLSLSFDASSWTWGFEATLPAKAESLVDPGNAFGPVELLASVNGTAFRVLAENISRERVFGEASVRVSGRGRNAVLAEPYAPVMTFANAQDRTARQLMDDVLTVNGVPLGWTVDWGLTDWNVPAGVFARQGTWIEALTAIADAAGGYLVPHRTAQSLRVRPRYPAVPWAWDAITPDFVLPVDAVARESVRWVEKPGYNRVFVSGESVGVLGQVTRTGTAGDILAPMVVNPLITEAAAARQRGITVLSDTGRQIEVSLRLPVLAETGIIEPGAFVEYQDGSVARLGLVRSTRVEAGWPEVWQTLGVETHA
jgi:hypothetical protein